MSGPSLSGKAFNEKLQVPLEGRKVIECLFEERFEGFELCTFIDKARESYRKDLNQTTIRMRAHIPDARGENVVHNFIYTKVPIHDDEGKVDGTVVYSHTT